MRWVRSWKADPIARAIADRHYNRQKIGAAQFAPPGRACVFRSSCERAAWITSWPFAQFVRHSWAGAWVNSLFRSEGAGVASELILEAVSATLAAWPDPPALGMVTFVDPRRVPGVRRRGSTIYGYCYFAAGFEHVGFTRGGLWAWQLRPGAMPDPWPAIGSSELLSRGSARRSAYSVG